MGKNDARPRPGRMIPVIGTSCGLLAAAAFAGGMRPMVTLPEAGSATLSIADDSTPADVSTPDDSGTAELTGGPLEIPSIGVVAPDFDERYAALLAASQAAPAPVPVPVPEDSSALVEQVLPAQEPVDVPPTDPIVPAPTPTPAAVQSPATPRPSTPPPTPPTDRSTDEVPPVEEPPAEEPAAEEPPAEEPPAEEPPAEVPPVKEPPAEEPAAEEPPAEEPPAEEPPAEETPGEEPPAEEPPAQQPPAEEPPAEEPPAGEPPAEEPPADVTLTPGETFDVVDAATGAVLYSIAVDSVTADVPCTAEGSLPAENGHLVGLAVRIATGAPPADGEQPVITPADFRLVGAGNATVATDGAAACLDDAAEFPTTALGPDQDITGTIVLDLPRKTGTIAYRPDSGVTTLRWQF